MIRPLFQVFATIYMGCLTPQTNVDPIEGTYVAWSFINGEAVVSDGKRGMLQKLVLKGDGTYTYQLESSVMMKLSIKGKGTYKYTASQVTISGTMSTEADDGYKKSSDSGPQNEVFKIEDGNLVWGGRRFATYFRKEGAGQPSLPANLRLKKSDPAAVALVAKIEKTYASLKSYRDSGTVKSHGGGFVAKDAKFKILFERPSKFRFEASQFDGGKEFDRAEITWNGGSKCWWYSTEYGVAKDRDLGNAMGIVSVNFGPEASLQPWMLLPNVLGDSRLKEAYPEVTLRPDEKLGNKQCAVLYLRTRDADGTKLWVDRATNMIVKYYEELRDVTVTFDPHPNVAIPAKNFMLGKRSKSGHV